MRMVGPNCMGLLNLDPEVRLSATFASVTPPPGGVAMSSQSGALGLAVLAAAERLGIGFSSFVSVGNKADVSGNDLLQYWEDDPHTRVILLYVESFGNPRRFARIARRVGQRKPIIAVKSGRTHAGTRAAGSHTAALASNDRAVDALFRQTGVIRADTMEEMFDLALLLSAQPLPRGPRVAILTNAGGPAILCADALEARGLEVVELGPVVREALLSFLPPEASVGNPVDMIASATPEGYERAAKLLLESEEVDALVAIYAPIEAADLAPVEAALQRAIRGAAQEKPVLTVLMGDEGRGVTRGMRDGVPSYAFPEAAARVLATAQGYAAWKARPQGNPVTSAGLEHEAARAICKGALEARGSGWLSHEEVVGVLRAAGLPEPLGAIAHSADEAAEHAAAIDGPVALKLLSRTLVHKTDVGGVLLDLENERDVRAAFAQMHDRLAADGHADAIEGILVQPMVSGGVEVMAGMTVDPVFGPIVAFGLGGILVEVLEDVAFRLTPLSREDAQEMLTSIRGRALLDGFRGSPAVDKDALVEILLRISQLSDRIPEIDDLDLNPIFIGGAGEGARVVDVRIHVAPV
jgi:acyl-CoA synthetase (NDP forming)